MSFFKMFIMMFLVMLFPIYTSANVSFDRIKGRKVVSFELTDIILDLSLSNKVELLDRWRVMSPDSFKGLNFTKSYVDAGDRLLKLSHTNQAIRAYIYGFQYIDKEMPLKIKAAYQASFLLYAQQKRSEALFYINRSIELLLSQKGDHELSKDIFYLKRRIVWRYFSRLDSLPDNAISSVEFDGDDVWIGMWSGGLGRFSRSGSQLQLFNTKNTALPSNYVRDILVRQDRIWIATHEGLAYYNKDKSTWHRVESMQSFKLKTITYNNGYYYVTTLFNGVYRSTDGENWNNIVPRESVLDVLHSGEQLFIATPERGVLVYSEGSVKRFLPNIPAKAIIEDLDSRYIWVGTYGQGLLKVDKNTAEIVTRYGEKELGSTHIESLIFVDGKLWVGTLGAGLSIYTPDENSWFYIGISEGLPGLDITTLTRENDYLWMGTLAGGIGIYQFR